MENTITTYLNIDQIVSTTHNTVNRLGTYKNGGDALILYFRYIQQRKMQNNSTTLSSTRFMKKAMGRGQDRFINAKKVLLESGMIEEIVRRKEDGTVEGWYIKVNFIVGVPESGTGGVPETPLVVKQVQNTLIEKKRNTLEENINTIIDGEKKDSNITKTQKQQSIENANNSVCEISPEIIKFFEHQIKNVSGVEVQFRKNPNYLEEQEILYQKLRKAMTTYGYEKLIIPILEFIVNDKFRCKNIGSIAKLLRKDKDGIPYYMRMVDKIKDVYVTPQGDVPLDISEKDVEVFEELWRLYPHTYQSNKDECLEIFSKSGHKESYIDGVRLILMQVAYGIKELQYIPAFKKFLINQQPLTEETMGVQCAEIRMANMKQTEQQRFQSKKIDDVVTLDFVKKVRAIAKKYQKALGLS